MRSLIQFLLIIGPIWAVLVFWFERQRRRALCVYWTRPCQGRVWRRVFPGAKANEIRTFLGVVTESFGFGAKRGLSFSPHDTILGIYRACYPVRWIPDALEVETLVRQLDRTYGVDLLAMWRDSLTLGEVFQRVQAA